MLNCEYEGECLNSSRCFVCNNHRLLKLPGDDKRKKLQAKAKIISKKKDNLDDCSKSWEDLESTVAAKLNSVPTQKQYDDIRESRRQLRSGAIWFMPGDVTDTVVLAECKERSTTTAKGEKSITIPKSWLTKINKEAKFASKYPCFMFRYKNDEVVYAINDFDTICDLILEIKFLRNNNDKLKRQNKTNLEIIESLKKEIAELKNREDK